MAGAPYDPLGQLPPLVNDEAAGAAAPWSWVPEHWNTPTADDPNEIQMPPVDARPQQVKLGFPVDPGPRLDQDAEAAGQAEIQMPAEDARPGASAPPPMPSEVATQPGLGIPMATFDAAAGQLPPMPDAISGGDWRANIPTAPGGNEYVPPEMHGEQLTDEQRAQQFAAMSPEDQARAVYARQQAEETERNKRIAQANLHDEQKALENHATLKHAQEAAAAATKKLEADAAEEAKREIDPSFKGGPLKKILGIIAGVLGGFVQNRQGGPNLGLQMIDDEINRSVEAQKANKQARLQELARRGASNQQLLAQAAADHDEAERWRITSYNRIQNQIATDMQQFDPRGKAAVTLGSMYASIGQARAKALADFQDKHFKDQVEAAKFYAEQRKALDEHNESLLKQQKMAGALGGGVGGATSGKMTPQQFAAMHPQIPKDQLPPDNTPRTDKEYAAYFEVNRKGGEAAKTTGGVSEEERKRLFGVAGLVNKDGRPWLARNEADAEKLATKHHVAREVVSIIDELAAIRDRVGGESSAFNSDESQRMKVLQNQLVKLAKSGTEGMSSEEDMNKLAAAAGADDVASFRSQAAKLAEARLRTLSALNSEFSSKGYDGPQITFANPYAGGDRVETPAEKEFKSLLGWQTSQYNYGKDADIIKGHGSPHPEWDARGYSDKQKAYADAAAAELSDATKGPAARTRLETIAKNADSPGFREYAQSLLAPVVKAEEGPVFK